MVTTCKKSSKKRTLDNVLLCQRQMICKVQRIRWTWLVALNGTQMMFQKLIRLTRNWILGFWAGVRLSDQESMESICVMSRSKISTIPFLRILSMRGNSSSKNCIPTSNNSLTTLAKQILPGLKSYISSSTELHSSAFINCLKIWSKWTSDWTRSRAMKRRTIFTIWGLRLCLKITFRDPCRHPWEEVQGTWT